MAGENVTPARNTNAAGIGGEERGGKEEREEGFHEGKG